MAGTTAFRRAFVQAGALRIHYRRGGTGAPVVMLHPSPLSSSVVLPVAAEIATRCEVFAVDTPGYGLSDPLSRRPASLADYLQPLHDVLDALGIQRCCLYGAATGAQIALEFAARFPKRVALLVMDTAGHIPAPDCERLVDGYFPDVTPRADGAHLATLWGLVRDLGVFFPWNDTRRVARIRRDLPPPAVMQAMLLDYLRAGARYDWAYRPAFYNERAERLRHCRVPSVLTRWPSSIALAITDALIAEGLPANFELLPLGPSLADRAMGIADAIALRIRDLPQATGASHVVPTGRFYSQFLDAGDLQLHARMASAGAGRPLVTLHAAGASARLLEPLLAPLVARRPLIAIDLPGHGESDGSTALPADLVEPVRQALDGLAVAGADLLGDGLGATVTGALHRSDPARFGRQAVLDRRTPVGAPWPDLRPRLDGGHLFEAWHMLRDRRLWEPWHERVASAVRGDADPDLSADSLHAELVELLKCGERFPDAIRREAGSGSSRHPEAVPMAIPADPVAAGATIRRWLGA